MDSASDTSGDSSVGSADMSDDPCTPSKTVSKPKASFTTAEKSLLLVLIEENKNVIEDKRTGFGPKTRKDRTWAVITNTFNSNSSVNQKTQKQIVNWWNNTKKRAKKQVS